MEDLIVSQDELKQMFKEKKILDTNNGWFIGDIEVEIIAIHNKEIKYITDMYRADMYKIVEKEKQ
jgi:hypothetical protein